MRDPAKTILLATIPHTGTHFFSELLAQHFPRIGFHQAGDGEKGFIAAHTTESCYDLLRGMKETPFIITTERNWDDVIASHDRRGKPLDRLIEHRRWWWRICDEFDPFFVSVDDPERKSMLKALGKRLGVEFETDWKPVNQWKDER